MVQEKIDEYFQIFNSSSASDLNHEETEAPKRTRGRKKKTETNIERENTGRVGKRSKKRTHSSDIENEILNGNEKLEEEEEEEEEGEDEPTTDKTKKTPEKIRTAAEILAKKTRAPAQEKVSKEIHEINERIIQLVQVKNMGMATIEQEKQLKKLLVEQKKKTNDLKRLKAEQAAKKRAREAKKVRKKNLHFTMIIS
jgi:hypothetical protein